MSLGFLLSQVYFCIDFLGWPSILVKMGEQIVNFNLRLETFITTHFEVENVKILDLSPDDKQSKLAAAILLSGASSGSVKPSVILGAIRKGLSKSFGANAVPKSWTVLDEFPLTPGGEIHVPKMLKLLAETSGDTKVTQHEKRDILLRALSGGVALKTTSRNALLLKCLWAEILRLDMQQIEETDSFLKLGGDSILAIDLSTAAQEYGLELPAASVLQFSRLNDMANSMTLYTSEDLEPTMPFSLAPAERDAIVAHARIACGLAADDAVEDTYPCSQMQEGFMALSEVQPGSYISRQVYRLPKSLDIERFKTAWHDTLGMYPSLRTRISLFGRKAQQHVIVCKPSWERDTGKGVVSFTRESKALGMGYGSRLLRYALVKDEGTTFFVLVAHHAVFDGLSVRKVLDTLYKYYLGETVEAPCPYSGFIRYTASIDLDAALRYWLDQLDGASRALFPRTRRNTASEEAKVKASSGVMKRSIPFAHSKSAITPATILRAAWAILLARYCDTDDICFGTTISGRQAPVPGLQSMVGPAIATVPVRVRVDPSHSVCQFLDVIQSQASEMIPFEQFGLSRIAKVSSSAKDACDFSSLLVIQPMQYLNSASVASDLSGTFLLHGPFEEALSLESMQDYFNYPLVLQPRIGTSSVELDITFDTGSITEFQLEALCQQYDSVVQQLLKQDDAPLSDLCRASAWDVQQAIDWNTEEVPEEVHACFHDLFEFQVEKQPHACALSTWDGDWTYRELSLASDRLAQHLTQKHNVLPGDLVLVCFDKSPWFIVSILAVNKAGATWTSVDGTHPKQRLQQIARQTKANLGLCSPSTRPVCSSLTSQVVEVTSALLDSLSHGHAKPGTRVVTSPEQPSYVLFTSGSTGTPKGIVMPHKAVCSSQLAIARRLGLHPGVRMLQFSSFVFDLCVGEVVGGLISGACICMPSEEMRMNDIARFIRDYRVNWMCLTPSFAQTISPKDVPGIEFLLLCGETVPQELLSKWCGKVRLVNGWAPAETCVYSTLHEWESANESPLTIGRPVASHCWVVNPCDHTQLAPVGTVGEIAIQGPTVMKEYLADEKKTRQSIVPVPETWPGVPRRWRVFKSGDLGYYNPDGTIEFCGRKDTQIKIRGLRVELSEIEHQIRLSPGQAKDIAVDAVVFDGQKALVAFFTVEDAVDVATDSVFLELSPELKTMIVELRGRLQVALPSYMIPSLFVPCSRMPTVTSSKLDRRYLRSAIAQLRPSDLASYSLVEANKRPPQTPEESNMQAIWSDVLALSPDMIGLDDSFFQLGGDSISAITLVSVARKQGIELEVSVVFSDPRLVAVADNATYAEDGTGSMTDPLPFELMPGSRDANEAAIRQACDLQRHHAVHDAYPVTSLQEGLMSLLSKQPGSYINGYVYKLPKATDIPAFKRIWQDTVQHCANLRTRIVLLDNVCYQAIIGGDFEWEKLAAGVDLHTFMASIRSMRFGFGSRLCRYALIPGQDGCHHFVWIIHHSVNDGWSMRFVLDTVLEGHQGLDLSPTVPYSRFIRYTLNMDSPAASTFWKRQLLGSTPATFPPRQLYRVGQQKRFQVIDKEFPIKAPPGNSVTAASIVRAAWSLVLSRQSGDDDIVFGATVSGRQAAVAGIESMTGLVIATVPVRAKLDGRETVSQFLLRVQAEATAAIPHEQYGLQNITQVCPEAKESCEFTSLLVIQPGQKVTHAHKGESGILIAEADEAKLSEDAMAEYFNYPLVTHAYLYQGKVKIRLAYDSAVLEASIMQALAHQLELATQQLTGDGDKLIKEVSLFSAWDAQQVSMLQNKQSIVPACVHWLIQRQIEDTPDAEAVDAWDGKLTYKEIGHLASRLALHLQVLGVRPDTIVPICLQKSMWVAVCMLGVQMSGAAFVPLDPSAPRARLDAIMKSAKAEFALVSPHTHDLLIGLGVSLIQVSRDSISELPLVDRPIASDVTPQHMSFVIFTSGSTGTPKGIVMQHDATCSSATAFGTVAQIGPGTRMFQFAAYTFDAGILDVLVALIRGGCVCIPSEEDRINDLAGAVCKFRANFAQLTPTVADLLDPAEVPCLQTLGLSGEAVGKQTSSRWDGKVSLYGIYGPAESSICSWKTGLATAPRSTNIGVPLYSSFWVVQPDDATKMVPFGCMGELLIEGPLLARGYLAGAGKASANFIDDASWLPGSADDGLPRRAYLTGDLVRQLPDGTFDYLGRKDSQVKLHGQRVELGEVEAQLSAALPKGMAGVVTLMEDAAQTNLCAIIWYTSGPKFDPAKRASPKTSIEDATPVIINRSAQALSSILPRYMVPTSYIILDGVPARMTSGKVDRRSLQSVVAACPNLVTLHPGSDASLKLSPTTDMQTKLRSLWAKVLHRSEDEIGRNDSFLHIGGNSVGAIKLVALAAKGKLSLKVADVFQHPVLEDMASSLVATDVTTDIAITPWSLISPDDLDDLTKAAVRQSRLTDQHAIQDMYPCTSMQEGLMALSLKQPGSYIAKHIFRLGPKVDPGAFKKAWELVVDTCLCLRTRVVQYGKTSFQALVCGPVQWDCLDFTTSLASYLETLAGVSMSYGSPLSRFALVHDSGANCFVWTVHHAAFDGWTISIVLDTLSQIYHQLEMDPPADYRKFIHHITKLKHDDGAAYWTRYLEDASAAPFPKSTEHTSQHDSQFFKMDMALPRSNGAVTTATLLRTTWALVISKYCGINDVCFGSTVSGRQMPVSGIESMTGPMIATLPVRIRIDQSQCVQNLLDTVQQDATDMISWEQFGLQEIAKLNASCRQACDFSNLLVIQPGQKMLFGEQSDDSLLQYRSNDESFAPDALRGYFTYPLVLQIIQLEKSVELLFVYDAVQIDSVLIRSLSHQFATLITQVADSPDMVVRELVYSSQWNFDTAVAWNGPNPQVVDSCVHHLFEEQARERPDELALYAWDQSFTYSQFNEAANILANYLVAEVGLRLGSLVYVCFERSAWHFVSILAINKAGGTWVPLEPSHPKKRQAQVISQSCGTLCLASKSTAPLLDGLVKNILRVCPVFIDNLEARGYPSSSPNIRVPTSTASYVLFTSGSTGTPKGFVMEHFAVCSGQTAIGRELGLGPHTRALQFASFVFDLSIGETFATLFSGGCLCVPSDHVRLNSLDEFVAKVGVNCIFATPSFARTIHPRNMPTVKTLILAGESPGPDHLKRWLGNARLFNGWGPAETCCFSTLHEYKSVDESPFTIGHPIACHIWVVEPNDATVLQPIGCVGEALIQGPTLLREYLNNRERTEATILTQPPEWAPKPTMPLGGRFYLSGDLVTSNPDGTLRYCGRKDSQVKIRGFRIELEEIEHHIREHVAAFTHVSVNVVTSGGAAKLVAHFCTAKTQANTGHDGVQFMRPGSSLQSVLAELVGYLNATLPGYMVPQMFIPCTKMPFITSTKLDKAFLKRMTEELGPEKLIEYSLVDDVKEPPQTEMERRVQSIWASILNISPDLIGRNDSFLRLGGDSISVIHFVSAAQSQQIFVSVKDIFDDPRLFSVALRATLSAPRRAPAQVEPFGLLTDNQVQWITDGGLWEQTPPSDDASVEDAYPCTRFQEGLMALAVKQPGSHIARYAYRIQNCDIPRFKTAWELTLERCANLRTRIVVYEGFSLQVVLQEPASWDDAVVSDLKSAFKQSHALNMEYGSRLCRYGVATDSTGASYFLWAVHHAIYDGWSMKLTLQIFAQYLAGKEPVPLAPYRNFVSYSHGLDQDEAAHFWREQLQGARRATYPRKRPTAAKKSDFNVLTHRMPQVQVPDKEVTLASVLRAAWAIVLARRCDTDTITFGTAVSGRNASVPGITNMVGPVVATVPVHMALDKVQTTAAYLRQVQNQAASMVQFEQYGLQNINKLSADIKDACDFACLFVIQPAQEIFKHEDAEANMVPVGEELYSTAETMESYFSFPLVFQCHMFGNHTELVFIHDQAQLPIQEVKGLAHQFVNVVEQLCSLDTETLADINVTSQWDISQVHLWNTEDPELMNMCVHEGIERISELAPESTAICGWDKAFTYSALDAAATKFAYKLIIDELVRPRDLVIVAFEKSAWYMVAIIAVNKAGAAWVPLDPEHPLDRQMQVINQTASTTALVSARLKAFYSDLVKNVVQVSAATLDDITLPETFALPRVCPSSPSYVLFTSGSTGTPKGLVMQHSAVCTGQNAIRKRVGLTPAAKMLQFASFVFDMSIGEMLGALLTGACLYVPSGTTRFDTLPAFITTHGITWLFLTPSFLRTLRPESVPCVEVIMLAGEAVGRDIFETWFGRVRLINGWGPAETCVLSTIHEWTSTDESTLTIGAPVGGKCWVVDADNHQNLAPIGCLGEVLVQGPTVLQEYLAAPQLSQASIISLPPPWAPNQGLQHWGRMFRSGDLAFYNADGTLEFVSRKDTQVKIRGFRVELGEVEQGIRAAMSTPCQVAVDVSTTNKGSSLVAYLCVTGGHVITSTSKRMAHKDDIFSDMDEGTVLQTITPVVSHLKARLPSYMVPTMFIPCRYFPFVTSGKLDRRELARLTLTLNKQDVQRYSLLSTEKRPPSTDMEKTVRVLWAHVLKMEADDIGLDDSFLQIGGDSISAIQVVGKCRQDGIHLSVKDIFDDPRLFMVARKAAELQNDHVADATPFSLLGTDWPDECLTNEIQAQCGLSGITEVEDIFPCAALQEGLMALTQTQPGSYIAKSVYQLAPYVEIQRFKAAWEETLMLCANLRTRIIQVDGKSLQVVLKGRAAWDEPLSTDHAAHIRESSASLHVGYGTRLCYYSLIMSEEQAYFVLMIHHAVFDGWSLALIMGTLNAVYHDNEVPKLSSYAKFARYTLQNGVERSREYWKQQLQGAQKADFPSSSGKASSRTKTLSRKITFPAHSALGVTKASVLRAAWAIVLGRYCDTDDVCFGETMSGRQANLSGIESMPGLTVATVPVRVKLNKSEPVSQLLQDIHAQSNERVAHEQFGIQNMVKISDDAKAACDFTSLLAIQPLKHITSGASASSSVLTPLETDDGLEELIQNYFSYPLVVQCHLGETEVDLLIIHNVSALDDLKATALARHFEHVVLHILDGQRSLGDISIAGPWDLDMVTKWNGSTWEQQSLETIHSLVAKSAAANPAGEAIYSTEGVLSYASVDTLSTMLAAHLVERGVRSDTVVPVLFEKSVWAIVSMLAIVKAGAAFVAMDPTHPKQRHALIVEEVGAKFAITSPSLLDAGSALVSTAMDLSAVFMNSLVTKTRQLSTLPVVSPNQRAYVVFTSGSTGKPKGINMTHGAWCASTIGQGKAFDITSESRVLQFSNFVFDGSLGEIFTTLSFGGTVCIPSDAERLGSGSISGFVAASRVNTAMLTPSFVATLRPEQLPTLKKLILGGEPASRDLLGSWLGSVRLFNGYGPAEACNYCATHEFSSIEESPKTIGRPFNGSLWVVDPENHSILCPVGCIGELLVQSPSLATGYLDKDKTRAAFVDPPACLSQSVSSKLYKTGDLVRYDSKGQLEYMGRKDTQAKLRGQRIELGEIEHQLKFLMPESHLVAVEVANHSQGQFLAAFFTSAESGSLTLAEETRRRLVAVRDKMQAVLPAYMVPSIFIPLRDMPFISAMKLDRNKLRNMVEVLSADELLEFRVLQTSKTPPNTELETMLQGLWTDVLNISPTNIGRFDSFLQLGGDSISAIRLSSLAEKKFGLAINVADIIRHPQLADMAGMAIQQDSPALTNRMDDAASSDGDIETQVQLQIGEDELIQSIYPCTTLQEGLMALTAKQPGSYIAKHIYRVGKNVNIRRFRAAWARVVRLFSILRTRIVVVDAAPLQVVLEDDVQWHDAEGKDLAEVIDSLQEFEFGYASRLNRYALVKHAGDHYFVWFIHHALFDGWTTQIIFEALSQAYFGHGSSLSPQPYSRFVQYVKTLDQQAATEYWTKQLENASKAVFPVAAGKNTDVGRNSQSVTKTLTLPAAPRDASMTDATFIRAAWAIVLGRYCNAERVCFGTTISGRQAPVQGIVDMAGPTLATVPVCVDLCDQSVGDFVQSLQTQATEMVPYEQFGLQNIAQLSSAAKEACDFASLLIIQPRQELASNDGGDDVLVPVGGDVVGKEDIMQDYFTYPLVLQCRMQASLLEFDFVYDGNIVSEEQLDRLAKQFGHVLGQLMTGPSARLKDVQVASQGELEAIMHWQNYGIDIVDATIHQLVSQSATKHAELPAVDAWDGQLTYTGLMERSRRLACHILQRFDVQGDDCIHVCFEKVSLVPRGHHGNQLGRRCMGSPGSLATKGASPAGDGSDWVQNGTDFGVDCAAMC